MNFRMLIASSLLAVAAASCGENAQPGSQSSASPVVKAADPQPQSTPRTSQGQAAQSPVPPADARWTILCDKIEGPAHVAQASMVKSRLLQVSRLNDWYIIHTEKESTIYYGYYRDLDNPGEKRRAEADRARIASLADAVGNPLVRGNILVLVTTPDPDAPADWNLLNTPPDAYWTIEIATFAGDVSRKEAAVQLVREQREKGKPAYFYHGPTASSVCIGAWKRSAVAEQGTGINSSGATRDDAHTQSADQPLFVMGDVLPPNMPSRVFEPGTGRPMTVVGQRLDIVDPDLKQKTLEFPYHFVNYEARGLQGGPPDASVLVVIPHDQGAATENDWRLNGGPASPANQAPAQRAAPSAAGDNVLRSIGDH